VTINQTQNSACDQAISSFRAAPGENGKKTATNAYIVTESGYTEANSEDETKEKIVSVLPTEVV